MLPEVRQYTHVDGYFLFLGSLFFEVSGYVQLCIYQVTLLNLYIKFFLSKCVEFSGDFFLIFLYEHVVIISNISVAYCAYNSCECEEGFKKVCSVFQENVNVSFLYT